MADFIVAIELGSSKITGIAGKKNLDGSIKVLAVVKEDATSCIRKGVVNNIDKTVQALSNVIKKLENILKTKIARVYVGVNGQSIRSEKNIKGILVSKVCVTEANDTRPSKFFYSVAKFKKNVRIRASLLILLVFCKA